MHSTNFCRARLESSPTLLAFAQTKLGKLCLLIIFAYGLGGISHFWKNDYWSLMILFISLITYFPAWRHVIILVATIVLLKVHVHFPVPWLALSIALSICILFIILHYFVHFKYPVFFFLCVVLLLIWGVHAFTLPYYFTLIALALINFFWFAAYSLRQTKSATLPRILYGMRYYNPLWSLSLLVPIPKGADYLDRIVAKNAEEQAICQIKAIKLLYWSFFILIIYWLMMTIEKREHIPTLAAAFSDYQAGIIYSAKKAWICLFMQFVLNALELTFWGHMIIALVRMCGFNALRNTYKPFLSTNIAEFWNRYYFYFKELLVEFFFYPTYFRCFKKSPKLRIFFATIMAAGVGNIIYHYLYYAEYPLQFGVWCALKSMLPYIFYCTVLSLAIGCSQLCNQKKRVEGNFLINGLAILWVNSFYLIMTIFDGAYSSKDIALNFHFLKSLFL